VLTLIANAIRRVAPGDAFIDDDDSVPDPDVE
jgi:hypothetical protein